jgi:hypothetical protein
MYKILDLSTGEYVKTYYGNVRGYYVAMEPIKEFKYITHAKRYLHDVVRFYATREKRNKNQFEIIEIPDV